MGEVPRCAGHDDLARLIPTSPAISGNSLRGHDDVALGLSRVIPPPYKGEVHLARLIPTSPAISGTPLLWA